jgi:hypothetical protein
LTISSLFSESLTFNIRSEYPYILSLALYSQHREKVWPDRSRVWLLKDNLTHTYKIECNVDEVVCYGAWVRNEQRQFWGVGYEGKQYCDSCCYRCNGASTPIIELKSEEDLDY